MKKITKNNFIRKLIIALCIVLVMAFTIPQRSFADIWADIGGTLLKEIVKLIASLGDIGMATLNQVMLGTDGFDSALIGKDDANLEEGSGSWLTENLDEIPEEQTVTIESDTLDTTTLGFGEKYRIPNMLFSPENIFANNIAVLDVNFLSPNQYTSAIASSNDSQIQQDADNASQSAAGDLKEVISSWYISFRNIAIVGLLSVLIYLGIRIMLSSTADDKAKYKESIKNWVVALCLVFIIHFIMSAILLLTDKAIDLFATSINEGFKVVVEGEDSTTFRTNLMGLIRFKAQAADAMQATAYTIMYMVLVVYTFRFTFIYFKRFLYTAFFTMIAPLVALTYPIDKAGDGKAQAFNMWIKEYTMNVIIQPVHLILYTVFVGSAMGLVEKNPLYAIVAIGFLIPAEKFIKKMFGLDRADSTGDFGSFAGGAVAMQALNAAKNRVVNVAKGGNSSNSKGGSSEDNNEQAKIRTPNRPTLGSFKNSSQNVGSSGNVPEVDKARTQQLPQANSEMSDEERNRKNQGYNQNENGEYFNPYNNEYVSAYGLNTGEQTLSDTSDKDKTMELPKEGAEERLNIPSNGKPPMRDGAKKELVIKGAKSLGKGIYKGAKRVAPVALGLTAGAVGVGTGFAIGTATGKPSNAFQYAATGAGIGAALGAGVGIGVPKIGEKAVAGGKNLVEAGQDKIDQATFTKDKTLYGLDYAINRQIERENAKARKNFLKDEKEQEKYEEMMGKVGYKGSQKDFMNAAFDLKEAGVKSEDMIKNALKLEMQRDGGEVRGKSHQNVVDVASFAEKNNYGRDYIEDEKKRTSMEGVVQSIIPDKESQIKVMQTFAGLHGREEFYKQNSKLIKEANVSNNTQSLNQPKNQSKKRGRPKNS